MTSNIMSGELRIWAELASLVKSPVASNLASLLRSMSELTDAELLALELPVLKQKVTVWDSAKHGLPEALELPEGILYNQEKIELSINPLTLGKAINYLILNPNGSSWQATTQAEIIRKAFPDTYR